MWLQNAVFVICGVRQNFSMAAVQAEDVSASFLFVGDLNCHRQEWLGSTTIKRNSVAAFDFARL